MSVIAIPVGGGGGNDPRLHVSDTQPDSSIVTEGDLWSKTTANELFRATDSSTFVSVETTGSGSMTTVEEEGVQVGGADIVKLNFKAGFDITEPVNTEIDIDLDLSELSDQTLQLLLAKFTAATELTISSGDVTVVQSYHSIDTESDASTDDLIGLNGGAAGDLLAIRPANDARTIVVKHNGSAGAVDNILLNGGVDISLTEIEDVLFLIWDATLDTNGAWLQVGGRVFSVAQAAVTAHEAAIDHDALTNFVAGEHIAEASIDHDALTNFVAGEHQLEAAIDHDALTNFLAAEHRIEAGIEFIIDGGGSAITTGIKGDLEIPFACTITAVRMFADQSGSIVVDIWKDTYANFPPTDADSITASAVPTISTAVKSEDATLTGWTTSVSKGDIIRWNVDSITSIERLTMSLSINRT